MHKADIIPHSDVAVFARDRHLHGRGEGWIDIHLPTSVKVERLLLWAADTRLASLAFELGAAYEILS